MSIYDLYDNEVCPGDFICCSQLTGMYVAKIQAISAKGTMYLQKWDTYKEVYAARVYKYRGSKFIKIAGVFKN